ncbi:MAG: hypothetical protein KGQ35_09925 [Burkholderiales bacterium]|jgi:hypothetical protein|nr:hypothetical protein [Burkholderiales bacterium]TBR74207.1 MAG: hypothetical protein EPN64_15870 [Burkholderiaceae bacterium]
MRQLTLGLFSVRGLLGRSARASKAVVAGRIESIRHAMLNTLGETGDSEFPQTMNKVRYAGDVQGLWYLRGELMEALANLHGEVSARREVEHLTSMFDGLLPRGLASRVNAFRSSAHAHH